jgi:hypothetical protein
MIVKPRSVLQQEASSIFQNLEAKYQPCEMLYIVSELTKTMSLTMLKREQAREEEGETDAL